MYQEIYKFLQIFGNYLARILPPFILASLVAALVGKKVSERSLHKLFSRGPASIVISAIIGAPLPICSCTVLPLAYAMRKKGVPSYSLVPFLISSPSVSLPSLLISLSLLGPKFTLFYVLSAVGIGLFMGLLEYSFPSKLEVKGELRGHCHVTFLGTLKELLPPIIIGTFIAALLSLVPYRYLFPYLKFPTGIITSAAISLPLYICSSGSVPIVSSLIGKGLFLGGGIIILILGPATNVSSLLTLSKIFGRGFTLRYLLSLASLTIAIGAILGALFS